jgi:hypothetical protein
MAREWARIGTDLWDEQSIQDLNPLEQRAYLLVTTQPDLSRCGVLPYTLNRWAKLAKGDTPAKLRTAFKGLEKSLHVALDEDYEELLVRTYVLHDGLLTQPQVVGAMVRDFRMVRSPKIRVAFLREIRRLVGLPLDEKNRRGLWIALGACENDKQRESVGAGLAPALTEAIEQGLVEPLPGGLAQGLPEGLAKALARPYPDPDPSGPVHPSHPSFGRDVPGSEVEPDTHQSGVA